MPIPQSTYGPNPFEQQQAQPPQEVHDHIFNLVIGKDHSKDDDDHYPWDRKAAEIEARTKELWAKEREIAEREETLRRRQAEAGGGGAGGAGTLLPPNWPPFYPILLHDPTHDGPFSPEGRSLLLIGSSAAYLLNLATLLGLVIIGEVKGGIGPALSAIIYAILVPPLGFLSWHWSLYKAAKFKSNLWYALFCLAFALQLVDYGLVGLGISQGSSGLIAFLTALATGHILAAILAGLSMAVMGLLTVLGAGYLLPRVLAHWRRGGGSLEGAVSEAAHLAKENERVRGAAIDIVLQQK